MRRNDPAAKAVSDKLRHASHMIDMGMGEKEEINLRRTNRPLRKREHWIVSLGRSAIYEDIYSTCLHEPA
jgi:hypothetical protein